jgi:hypothetical protein
MTEIKVQCDCGQKYKFEVEPLNGQMPYAITCPICGLDGTKKANAILKDPPPAVPVTPPPIPAIPAPAIANVTPLAPSIAAPAPMRISMTAPVQAPQAAVAAPLAGTPAETAVSVSASAERPKLRISSAAHSPAASEPAGAAPIAVSPARPRPIAGIARPTAAVEEKSGRKPSFALGLLGGFAGALLGGAIYFLVFSYSGWQIGLMAIGVGFLAGLGARVLGKEGSNELGVITATLTVVGVLGAQYFVAWKWWHEASIFEVEESAEMYRASVKEAKTVMAAIPTGSDQEIRIYLAREEAAGTGEAPQLNEVTTEEIKEFRETQLPEYRDLASGKTTKEAYEKNLKDQLAKIQAALTSEEKKDDDSSFKFFFMLLLLNKVNLFSLAAGAGLAYKMSTDAPG